MGENIADDFDLPAARPQAGDVTLESMRKAMREAEALSAEIEQAEAELKERKSRLLHIRRVVLPELMITAQSVDFTLDSTRYVLEQQVSGTLPKEPNARSAAIKWLESHEADGLIKNEITLDFARSEHNVANDLYSSLQEQGFSPVMEATVHPQTLMAFVRERLRNGKPMSEEDQKTLGVELFQIVKMTPLKKDK